MYQGALGIITGFVVWSILWATINFHLPLFFPKHFNLDGTTDSVVVDLVIVLLSFDFSFISGYINAIIAKTHEMRFAVILGIIQMGVSIYVLKKHWPQAPLWFHLAFLILIIPGIITGVVYKINDTTGEIQ